MSKTTYRFFFNDNRVATAVQWKNKSGDICILEVMAPSLKPQIPLQTFQTVQEWEDHCQKYYIPKPVTRVEVTKPTKETPKKKTWICPACNKGSGNDHRMCICRAFNYSVAAWEEACGIRQPEPEEQTSNASASPSASTKKEDWTYEEKRNAIFPPGKYYIGDLCYVLGDPLYDGVFGGYKYESGLYTEKKTGLSFLVDGTAWGDGEYEADDGNKFSVDAGIIGICPVALMAKDDGGGHIYEFKYPVECKFKHGRFSFTSGTNFANTKRITILT